jgi:protein translocase SecG subunit
MKNLLHASNILTLANILAMLVLIILITLQSRSSGLSTVFGGAGGVTQTRRGVEKWLFYATIIFAVIFVGLSITHVLIK